MSQDFDKDLYIEIDGFVLLKSLWEEIKYSYVNTPTAWEEEVSDMAMNAIKEVLILIDYWIKEEDYTPSASSEIMFETAHSFLNNRITLEVLDNNYVMQERYLELLCGLSNKELEANIMLLLTKLDAKLQEFSYMIMH